jgi:hypothetical protein
MGKQMKVIFEIYHQANKSYAKFFISHQDFLYWQLSLEYLGGHILYHRYDGQIEKLRESLIDCGTPEDDMKIIRLDLVSNSSEKYIDRFQNSLVTIIFNGTYQECIELFKRYNRLWQYYLNQQANLDPRNPQNQLYPEYSSKNYAYFGYASEEDFIVYEQIAKNLSYDDSHYIDNLACEDSDWAIRDINKAFLHEAPDHEYQGYYDGYQEGYHEHAYDPY